jgi:hypothetical protein
MVALQVAMKHLTRAQTGNERIWQMEMYNQLFIFSSPPPSTDKTLSASL